jgi:hypothetical protein
MDNRPQNQFAYFFVIPAKGGIRRFCFLLIARHSSESWNPDFSVLPRGNTLERHSHPTLSHQREKGESKAGFELSPE